MKLKFDGNGRHIIGDINQDCAILFRKPRGRRLSLLGGRYAHVCITAEGQRYRYVSRISDEHLMSMSEEQILEHLILRAKETIRGNNQKECKS